MFSYDRAVSMALSSRLGAATMAPRKKKGGNSRNTSDPDPRLAADHREETDTPKSQWAVLGTSRWQVTELCPSRRFERTYATWPLAVSALRPPNS